MKSKSFSTQNLRLEMNYKFNLHKKFYTSDKHFLQENEKQILPKAAPRFLLRKLGAGLIPHHLFIFFYKEKRIFIATLHSFIYNSVLAMKKMVRPCGQILLKLNLGLIFFFLCVLSICVHAAGPGDIAGQNMSKSSGARVLALGGTFTAIADDANAIFLNPAGILQKSGHFLDGGYSFDSDKKFHSWHLSIVNSSPAEGEAAGFGFTARSYNLSQDEKDQYVAMISLAQPYGGGFSFGGNAKYIKVNSKNGEDEKGFSFDLGIFIKLQKYLSFGVMGYDLGKPDISTNPRKVRVGLGLNFKPAVIIAVDVDHFSQENVRQLDYHYGIEVLPQQSVSLQAGYFTDRLNDSETATGGFTFNLVKKDRIDCLSYAYSEELREGSDGRIEKLHSISIGLIQ